MGDLIEFPVPEPRDPEDLPFTVRDAYGNECYAEDEKAALLAAYTLQEDAWKALMTQGSGKQCVTIFHEGRHVMTIDRRIMRHEVIR